MTTSEGSSPAARLISFWWKCEEEKGIGRIPVPERAPGSTKKPQNPYRQHAVCFNQLLAVCNGDEATAQRSIRAYFDDHFPAIKAYGWPIGMFQKRMRGYVVAIHEQDARKERDAKFYQEKLAEARERLGGKAQGEAGLFARRLADRMGT